MLCYIMLCYEYLEVSALFSAYILVLTKLLDLFKILNVSLRESAGGTLNSLPHDRLLEKPRLKGLGRETTCD